MVEIRETSAYAVWFAALRDRAAKARIDIRIRRLSLNYGPGYRVYFIKQGEAVVILLAGGSKSTQQADIRQAKDLARNL